MEKRVVIKSTPCTPALQGASRNAKTDQGPYLFPQPDRSYPCQVTQPDVSVLKEVRESAFGFLTTSDYQSMERYLPDGLNARLRDVEPEFWMDISPLLPGAHLHVSATFQPSNR